MGVDVEIGIGDKTEIFVFLAVEVEGYAVAADETWVLAYCSWSVAICQLQSKIKNFKS